MKLLETNVKRLNALAIPNLLAQVSKDNLNVLNNEFDFLIGKQKSEIEHILKSSYVAYFTLNSEAYHAIKNHDRLEEHVTGLYGGEFGVAIRLTNLMYLSSKGARPFCDLMQALSDSSDEWKELLLSFPKSQTKRFEVGCLKPQYPMLYCESSNFFLNECFLKGLNTTIVDKDIGYIMDDKNEEEDVQVALKSMASAYGKVKDYLKNPQEVRPLFIACSFILSGNVQETYRKLASYKKTKEFVDKLGAALD